MAANLQPIFPLTINNNATFNSLTVANTAKDGTGTVVTIFTAGANGARLDSIKVRALGTNVATVMRFFINNGGVNSTPSNNALFHEVTLAATTLSEVSALADTSIYFNGVDLPQVVLKPGYKINVTIGTSVAAGLMPVAIGGDY